MKSLIRIIAAVIAAACLLSACSMDITAEAEPFIKKMLNALSEDDVAAASGMLHPSVEDTRGLEDMAEYLDGRSVVQCTQYSVNVSSRVGTGGTVKTESGTLLATMDDGTEIYLTYTYQSDDFGRGFTSFRISLGV